MVEINTYIHNYTSHIQEKILTLNTFGEKEEDLLANIPTQVIHKSAIGNSNEVILICVALSTICYDYDKHRFGMNMIFAREHFLGIIKNNIGFDQGE